MVGQVDQRRVDALEAALERCSESRQRSSLLSLLAVEMSYAADLDRRLSLSGEAVGWPARAETVKRSPGRWRGGRSRSPLPRP